MSELDVIVIHIRAEQAAEYERLFTERELPRWREYKERGAFISARIFRAAFGTDRRDDIAKRRWAWRARSGSPSAGIARYRRPCRCTGAPTASAKDFSSAVSSTTSTPSRSSRWLTAQADAMSRTCCSSQAISVSLRFEETEGVVTERHRQAINGV
jgi:hypothetical protein